MQWLSSQLTSLDMSGAVLLVFIGLVYGLFGWRLVKLLVMVDALAVAILCVYGSTKFQTLPLVNVPTLPVSLAMLGLLPLLAWKFPVKANVVMAGLAGFVSMQLFLMDLDWPLLANTMLGLAGAGIAMALAVTIKRQTTVIVTGLHGGWLCVGALAILAMNHSNVVGEMLNSMSGSFTLITPLAAVAFSAILIFLQWSDMQGHTSEE